MTADEYVKEYNSIVVPGFVPLGGGAAKLHGMGVIFAPVLEYCNIKHTMYSGHTWSERQEFKDYLAYTFFPKRAAESDSGVTSSNPVKIPGSWAPLTGFPLKAFQTGFGGKGTPGLLRQLIQLISYWRSYLVEVEGKAVAPVADVVSKYLGIDCNALVGNYLARKFPGIGVEPTNPEESYVSKAKSGGLFRKGPKELKADDIVIYEGHISILDSVISTAADHAMCNVSESRTSKEKNGGPQTNLLRMSFSSGDFSLPGHKPISAIVRIPGMGT